MILAWIARKEKISMNETEPPKKPYKIRLKEISNLQKKVSFFTFYFVSVF